MSSTWMLYGATGYSGALIAREAVRRGHKPTLAGRSRNKLEPLAQELALPFIAVGLEDASALRQALQGHRLVLHAAGPFADTGAPMVQACLDAGASYLDLTGEVSVMAQTFRRHREAQERGVALIPGVGFDVVPTDCLAVHLAKKVPHAASLELALSTRVDRVSPGTARSAVEMAPQGGLVRRDGELQHLALGRGGRRAPFPEGPSSVVPAPLGDLETAFHSTGIPNITTYLAMPDAAARLMSVAWPLIELSRVPLRLPRVRRGLQELVGSMAQAPDERLRQTGRTVIWGRVETAQGEAAEAWLATPEPYQFTSLAAVRAVEAALEKSPSGALTPAQAFGADFVLGVPGVERTDREPGAR